MCPPPTALQVMARAAYAAARADRERHKRLLYAALYNTKKRNTKTMIATSWIICSAVDGGRLEAASNPLMHASYAAARSEAQRLARQHPGKRFIVFESVSTSRCTGVTTERHFNCDPNPATEPLNDSPFPPQFRFPRGPGGL
jgi:hypothetical protein